MLSLLLAAVVTIPPAEITAYNMPDTKPIREPELEGKFIPMDELAKRSVVLQFQKILADRPKEGRAAKPGFIVTEKDPLKEAVAVLKGRKRRIDFTTDESLRLVFFAHQMQDDTAIDRVEIDGREITVHYHFIRKSTPLGRWNIAVIPLGKLKPRDYRVRYVQGEAVSDGLARPRKHNRDVVRRMICSGFEFGVKPADAGEEK
ncbi:MAG: hypothetical protein CMJ58_12225 [Planctomycetaceae bacterium]|nr:hypothetical protein [Planctomycetaceae bacterium]